MNKAKKYDVLIVGGGVSGTALFYMLAQYTNLSKIALLEKYNKVAQVNSKGKNNSQTLHVGDIETNYSPEKTKAVRSAAMMIPSYVRRLHPDAQNKILFRVPKMVLAVGKDEIAKLGERYEEIRKLYPDLQKLNKKEIGRIEPNITKGRKENEELLALYTPDGYAVDYEMLAVSFTKEVKKKADGRADLFLGQKVKNIKRGDKEYQIETNKGIFEASIVVVNADSYSLLFAKSLGYGKKFSLIPVAGNFYFSDEVLNGKVYTMQDQKLPFAAVHGDPDVQVPGKTRWGPTAKFFPVLESGKPLTSLDYFKSAGLFRYCTIKSFIKILSDFTRFKYLLKNALYDFPLIGKIFFMPNIRKIVPLLKARDIKKAKGFGGMRLQRVDTETHELQLGEGRIVGDNIIFNMTPSPGASACLFNAVRDTEEIMSFFDNRYKFDKHMMENECVGGYPCDTTKDVSADFYSS
ncbi:FAD-dependent oxidoreductase [Candidatus Campbellbacteria bacterium CG11_big_fil_rev_8_21_14_0_20_44_21]|uniref:malate dehydrogenase (quinone) n=1 Tax=Candidatus Campbellbacteria bacterium CG22_combo_CG10-13_8_21_14_all_43_18 TaxID=1974530 RepID=A0A2H0DX70_9BACT|nr:MAG: FAD-dependent oxidoreductase [Candidatus Campbellbacteria bacterium CG22_combo_CG10-13_8_21_14_all_43_18]PIR24403.1 MAG: FAD-dependent oxidoreductase [Candidatus Campbellbacteria bacterium CG11_big_fil_rev_8_21_14_0_20_44_21]